MRLKSLSFTADGPLKALPYKIAANMKLPGTYAAYAAMMAVFGETPAGIRVGLMLFNVAATILVFLLAKYLYGWLAGAVAGMTYSFLSCRPAVLGLRLPGVGLTPAPAPRASR